MSQLSNKILSYSPEIYRILDETTVSGTSSVNLGTVSGVGYSVSGPVGNTTYNSDSPIGAGTGSWNLNQVIPSTSQSGITLSSNTTIGNIILDRDHYHGMWFKYATIPSAFSAQSLMRSNGSAASTNSGFQLRPIARTTGGGATVAISVSNGTAINSYTATNQSVNIADGNWHYVAVRRYGDTFDTYLDGVLVVTATSTVVSTTYSNAFGTNSAFSQQAYNMRIGHIHIGTTANFTASAPLEIYTAGSTLGTNLKYWDGTAWTAPTNKYQWDGVNWITMTGKFWNGSTWTNIT